MKDAYASAAGRWRRAQATPRSLPGASATTSAPRRVAASAVASFHPTERLPETVAEETFVMVAHAPILDPTGKIVEIGFQRRTPLGRVHGAPARLGAPQQLGQRLAIFKQRAESRGTMLGDETVGILAGGQADETQAVSGRQQGQGALSRPPGGALAAVSPSRHTTGSGAMRHSSRICCSVRAVPSGATA